LYSYPYTKAVPYISQFKVNATLTDTMLTKLNRITLSQYSLYLKPFIFASLLSSYIKVSFSQEKMQKKKENILLFT
ncbi:hypothetical protein CWS01_17685, partial [Niallia nealsonii]